MKYKRICDHRYVLGQMIDFSLLKIIKKFILTLKLNLN